MWGLILQYMVRLSTEIYSYIYIFSCFLMFFWLRIYKTVRRDHNVRFSSSYFFKNGKHFPEAFVRRCPIKLLSFFKIVLFKCLLYKKRTQWLLRNSEVVFSDFWETLQNSCLAEHGWRVASGSLLNKFSS